MKNNLKKVKEFFLTDVKKVNKFLLLIVILVILSGVSLTSFALFSYEVYSPTYIMLTYDDLKGPKCVIEGPSANEVNINTNATYTMTCTDKAGVVEKDITSNDFVVEGDITIQNITKETVTNGFKYTINILSGTTDSVANIKFKENIIQDNNGNNNKESNVSNNITVKTYSKFYIAYGGTNYEYHFDDGMTFNSFISSGYSDGKIKSNGNYLLYNNKYDILLSNSFVAPTAAISENAVYSANSRAIYKNGYSGLYWGVKSSGYSGSISSTSISASGNGTSEWMYEGYIILCETSSTGYDFTNYSTLVMSSSMLNAGYTGGLVGYLPYKYYPDAPGTNSFTGYKKVTSTSYSTYTLDISGISGKYCIGITGGGQDFYYSTRVREIYLR